MLTPISDLALRNFIEMRDLTGQPSFLLRKKIESRLSLRHPDKWLPLYSQVTFFAHPLCKILSCWRATRPGHGAFHGTTRHCKHLGF